MFHYKQVVNSTSMLVPGRVNTPTSKIHQLQDPSNDLRFVGTTGAPESGGARFPSRGRARPGARRKPRAVRSGV